jgi:hypothetical protein
MEQHKEVSAVKILLVLGALVLGIVIAFRLSATGRERVAARLSERMSQHMEQMAPCQPKLRQLLEENQEILALLREQGSLGRQGVPSAES